MNPAGDAFDPSRFTFHGSFDFGIPNQTNINNQATDIDEGPERVVCNIESSDSSASKEIGALATEYEQYVSMFRSIQQMPERGAFPYASELVQKLNSAGVRLKAISIPLPEEMVLRYIHLINEVNSFVAHLNHFFSTSNEVSKDRDKEYPTKSRYEMGRSELLCQQSQLSAKFSEYQYRFRSYIHAYENMLNFGLSQACRQAPILKECLVILEKDLEVYGYLAPLALLSEVKFLLFKINKFMNDFGIN